MDNEAMQERKAHIEHLAGKLLSAAYAALLATQHLQSTADTNAATTRPDGVPIH